jgi:hypothetical protein
LSLEFLASTASKGGQIMLAIKDCLITGATIGEICNELSESWAQGKL